MPFAPMSIDEIETLLTTSKLLPLQGFKFEQVDHNVWELNDQDRHYLTTFNPAKHEEQPSLRLMLPGEPLLEKLLDQVLCQCGK